MCKSFKLQLCICICLFTTVLVSPYMVIENVNAKEFQQIGNDGFLNIENHKNQVHIKQGTLSFNFGEKEKKIRKDGIASRMNKEESRQQETQAEKGVKRAKERAPIPRFLVGGPTKLRVPLAPTKKRGKAKRKKLRLPTWEDK